MLYAKFTPEGIPGHIIDRPQDGYDALPKGMTVLQAAALMLVNGEWVKRPPPPPPTVEELAAMAEAQRLADIEAAAVAAAEREERIERRCIRLLIQRQLGQLTQTQFAAAVAAIRAEM